MSDGEVLIEIRGLEVMCRIGVTDAELEVLRPLIIDITLRPAEGRSGATESDELAETVDYAEIAGLAAECARSRPHRTLERLAARIADAIVGGGQVDRVDIRVAKPDPPMPEQTTAVAVRLSRSSGGR